MKKKLLASLWCLAMTVSAMAGCGSKQDAAPADTGSQSTDASAQSGEKDAAPASSDSAGTGGCLWLRRRRSGRRSCIAA